MISHLFIQNLILVEKAEIAFGSGLNIITGETGCGKSALLSAIRLLLGGKADLGLIRNGAPFAMVEAQLILKAPFPYLEEEEIAWPESKTISIRREIHRSGKNRCFFEEQQINLTTLKKIVGSAIELVDQSSSSTLSSHEEQRKWLDAFGSIQTTDLAQTFEEEKTLSSQLQETLRQKEKADLEETKAKEALTLIEETDWKEGEEERLTQEHNLLTNAQELLETIAQTIALLAESQEPIIPLLKRTAHSLEHLLPLDKRLLDPFEMIKRSSLELEEAAFSLRSFADRLEADPNRLNVIEERLATLEKIKKKWGSWALIEKLRVDLSHQIDHFSTLEEKIDSLQIKIASLQKQNLAKANFLTQERKKTAISFANSIRNELHSLNLKGAEFTIAVKPKELSFHGADAIDFLFSANLGYPPLPLEQCASGGELSRLLLAIKLILADKENSTCLIFDEIDSNVGGQTATILGHKLKNLSQMRQILCVTHFVQVAKCATHHFVVTKNEAVTSIRKLALNEQETEFHRMLGNECFQK